ncbi:MAG: acetoacetate--CoA ligase [Burkholderiaceae bacterium]
MIPRADTRLHALIRRIETAIGRRFESSADFHDWSCTDPGAFWTHALMSFGLPFDGDAEPACQGSDMAGARFFPRLRLNAAQWLLWPAEASIEDATAIVVRDESGGREHCTRAELRERALKVAAGLRAAGVRDGDRVVAIGRNSLALTDAFLGTTALGAVWSSVGPELRSAAVLARFGQLAPSVLFVDERYRHHGQQHDLHQHLAEIIRALPSLRLIVRLHAGPGDDIWPAGTLTLGELSDLAPLALDALPRLPFDHPMLILFTSGTTGKPKCLVHGVGGTLLEHLKEHRLHGDYGADDRMLFVTSCGWMMWNWSLSALASAMPLVLYDGSVSYPDADALPRVLADEAITVFGAGPAYFQMLEHLGSRPAERFDLSALRTILSTGSVLHEHQFDWIHAAFGDLRIESISGGTDIVGCFVLGHPMLPAVRGDSTGPGLGMALRVVNEHGIVATGEGDLVCVSPFPSRPVAIWGDADGKRLHQSYYAANPGCWTHGDRALIRPGGSIRILGRSDGVMNIRGVRIGPAEIQSAVQGIAGVREAMAAAQPDPGEPGGERIVLLVVLDDGVTLARPLILQIKRTIRDACSALHVPALVQAVDELPVTHSGKLAEAAVRAALAGRPVVNREALRNPEALIPIAALAVGAGRA